MKTWPKWWHLASLLVLWGTTTFLCGCNLVAAKWNNAVAFDYYRQGNYALARDAFRRAIIQNPTDPDYWHNLATVQKKMGELASAEQNYRRALTIDPSHQPSYHGLAQLLLDEGRQEEALALLQGWTDVEPYRAEPYIELAWLQREMGDLAGAEKTLLQALKVHPNNYIANAHLGQIYQDLGRYDLALAMYQRSLFTNWNQPQVKSRIAQLGYSPTALMVRPVNTTVAGLPPHLAYTPPVRSSVPQTSFVVHSLPSYHLPTSTAWVSPTSPAYQSSGWHALSSGSATDVAANADPAHVPGGPSSSATASTNNGSIPEVEPF